MAQNRRYDHDFKVQAVLLAKEIGQRKAGVELGISKNTIATWVRNSNLGKLDLGSGNHTPSSAMSLNEEIASLRKQV